MNFGEAFIEVMLDVPTSQLLGVEKAAAKAGQRAGDKLGEGIEEGAKKGSEKAQDALGDAGDKGGTEAGKRATGSFVDAFNQGKGKLLGAAAGIGLSLTAGIVSTLNVTGASDKLRAQLNLTATESGKLGKAAGQLYANNYGSSLEDVNNAIANVVRDIPKMRTASIPVLKDISAGALDIARVFDQDVQGVTRAVGVAMRTGLAPDAKSALDLITTGFQKIPNAGEDLLDTLNEYGVQFQKLGLDGPHALGLINQLMLGGARNTDLAADAIKEFSIRAIDGSATTTAGFKALGLNAKDMAEQIGRGGPSAEKAFGTVLDKLNSIEDPVKRNIAGVNLFGTQWEDLGNAFRKADLDTAAQQLGKTADATKGIADQSAQGRLQTFIRTLQQGFVEILGNEVLPRVLAFNKWAQEHKALLITLASVIGVLTAAVVTYNVAVAVSTAVTKAVTVATTLWSVATKVAAVASNAWAVAQWALNAAMTANPIGVVIVIIAALVAAIILAYKHSETFRKIVQAAWEGIQTAAKWAWDNVLKPTFNAIVTAAQWVGDKFVWLWKNVIQPAWTGIQAAINVAWMVIQVIFKAIQAYVNVLAAIFTWLWKNIITPVWAGIHLAIQIAWVAIRIIFGLIEIGVRAQAAVFTWLWKNVIVPVWNGIKTAISAAWTWLNANVFQPIIRFVSGVFTVTWRTYQSVVSAVWSAIRTAISAAWNFILNSVLNPLRAFITGALVASWNTAKNAIISAWNAIKAPISAAWSWLKSNVFTPLSNLVTQTIPHAFSTGVNAVGKAWDGIKEKAKVPVKFVVDTVINNGIIKGFNWIASKVGASTISPIKLGFASGGILPGYTPGRDVHRFMGPAGQLELSGGEAIMRPEFTKAVGAAFVNAGNAAARSGGVKGVRNFLKGFMNHGDHPQYAQGGVYRFAKGGILGSIVGGIKKAWDVFTNPVDAFKSGVNKLMGGIPGGPFMQDMLRHTVTRLVDNVASWITSKFNAFGGGLGSASGPGKWQAMWNWIHSRFPQAQLYSGYRPGSRTLSGNLSYHSMGRAIDVTPLRDIAIAIKNTFGRNVKELITPWPELDLWNGKFHDYDSAIDAQHGVYGSNAHVHWAMRRGGIFRYDRGGWFNPGQLAMNGLRKPEAVLTPEESRGLKAMGTDRLIELIEELIDAVNNVAPGVGNALRGSGRGLIARARQA